MRGGGGGQVLENSLHKYTVAHRVVNLGILFPALLQARSLLLL